MPKNKICSGCHYPYKLLEPYMGPMCSTGGKCSSVNISQREAEIRARLDERKRVADTNVEAAGLDYKYPNIGFAAAITVVNSERIIELEAQLKDTTKGENDE